MRGDRPWLTGVIHLGIEKVVEAPVDLAGHRVQHVGSLRQCQSAPRPFERFGCRPHGKVDLLRTALGYRSDQTAVDRRDLLELPLGGGRHEAIADEMQKSCRAHGLGTLRGVAAGGE